VVSAFADPGALSDLGAQLHDGSWLGRVFDIDGSVDIRIGDDQ
jgi:hypothetical protein